MQIILPEPTDKIWYIPRDLIHFLCILSSFCIYIWIDKYIHVEKEEGGVKTEEYRANSKFLLKIDLATDQLLPHKGLT